MMVRQEGTNTRGIACKAKEEEEKEEKNRKGLSHKSIVTKDIRQTGRHFHRSSVPAVVAAVDDDNADC
mgnify:CR=1 FL=1